jgi:pimeloyl-ACP methyl ester carboxylesterase
MRQAPERVARLALVNTQARPDTPEITARRRSLMAQAKAGAFHEVLDEQFPLLVHRARSGDAAIRKLIHDMGDDVGAEGFVNNQTAIIGRVDSRPTMATIRCPALVLSGDDDQLIPNSLSKEMADGIAGAKLVILSDCGHCPQAEQPQATVAALADWMRM